MLDLQAETPLPANKLPGFIEKLTGRRPHKSTTFRWMLSGTLESVKVGGSRVTSEQAVRRFIARCTQRHHNDHPVTDNETFTHRAEEAGEKLSRMGI